MTRAIGYLRVSTAQQSDSGAGLAAQKSAISSEIERRNWDILWVEDVQSGKNLRRDGVQEALRLLKDGDADVLVVAKLDRLSRSVIDFAQILERARKQKWSLVALDLGVDTTTPAGELIANVMISVAQWERRVIGQRTSEALQERKAQGQKLGGSKPLVSPEALELIRSLSEGRHPNAIARAMDASPLLPPGGGRRWYASTVTRILRGQLAA